MDAAAVFRRVDRPAWPEGLVFFQGQVRLVGRGARDDAAELLERPVRVLQAGSLFVAREPAGELREGNLPGQRNADALQELRIGQEPRLLVVVAVVQAVVGLPGPVGQMGGPGHVQHVADGLLELLQHQHRLAAAGGADDDERRRQREGPVLRVVEEDHLVQHVERAPPRIQVGQLFGFLLHRPGTRRHGPAGLVPVPGGFADLVHRRPQPEEPGPVVGVVGDVLQHQDAGLLPVSGEGKQYAVAAVEPGPEQVVPDLPGIRGTEVPGLETRPQLGEVGNPVRIQALVEIYLQNESGGVGPDGGYALQGFWDSVPEVRDRRLEPATPGARIITPPVRDGSPSFPVITGHFRPCSAISSTCVPGRFPGLSGLPGSTLCGVNDRPYNSQSRYRISDDVPARVIRPAGTALPGIAG